MLFYKINSFYYYFYKDVEREDLFVGIPAFKRVEKVADP